MSQIKTLNSDLTDQEVVEFRDFISRCKVPAAPYDARPPGWKHLGGGGFAAPSMELRYFNAMPRLLDARDCYRRLLKRIEWEGRNGNDDVHSYCPACDSASPSHKPACELAVLIRPK